MTADTVIHAIRTDSEPFEDIENFCISYKSFLTLARLVGEEKFKDQYAFIKDYNGIVIKAGSFLADVVKLFKLEEPLPQGWRR